MLKRKEDGDTVPGVNNATRGGGFIGRLLRFTEAHFLPAWHSNFFLRCAPLRKNNEFCHISAGVCKFVFRFCVF